MAVVQTELDEALIELDTLKVTLANAEQRIIELEGLLAEENAAKDQYEAEKKAEEEAAANANGGGSKPATPPASSGGGVWTPPAGVTPPGQTGDDGKTQEGGKIDSGTNPGDEGLILK